MTRPTVHFPRILACAAAVLALFAVSLPAQDTQTVVPSRLTQPIDESVRVTFHGYIAPQANAANDRGVAPDSMPLERIHLVLKRSSAQEAALQQLVAQMHTPGSANYHKWLTPAQFGQQFGPSDRDIATVESWLSSHGFQVTGVEPGKQVIEFSGNVAQLREAFHAQIHRYQVNGNIHYATATEPDIPAALAPVVGGFDSLNDFQPHTFTHVLGTASYNPKTDHATPNWTYGTSAGFNFVLAPGDFAVQYDLPTSTAEQGQGETIAILDFANVNMDLVKQFRTLFNLPTNNLPQVIIDGNDPGIDGINNPDGPNYASIESYLDVEWAGAVAPQATIDLVIAADTALENGGLLAAEHAVYSNIAPIISSSIDVGGCEQEAGSLNAFMSSLWEEAAAQGQTVVVAAGDSGSAGCDNENTEEYAVNGLGVNSWASTPYDVAVGGTDFYYSDWASGAVSALNDWNPNPTQAPGTSLLKSLPEQPWNDSQYGLDAVNINSDNDTNIVGGSGGASSSAVCAGNDYDSSGDCVSSVSGYAKPSWQTGTGTQTDKVRDIPDVSLFAADGVNYSYYPICASDGDCQPPSGNNLYQITGVGGTSAAAPTFAAIMALVDQKYGSQGQADFVLYPLKTQFPAAFHDITNGTNSVPCGPTGQNNCISVTDGLTVGGVVEGQLGTGTTADYNAAAGYNLATGLGSVDANVLINDWGNVTFKSTSVTLAPSRTSFSHGTPITISGSVTGSGTPTGDVALMTDSTLLSNQGEATFALSDGSYSGSINYLPGGTYNIWGQYSGDGTNAASKSATTQITVTPENSTTLLYLLNTISIYTGETAVSSGQSVPYGSQLILDAEPIPTSCASSGCSSTGYTEPTGTVTFADNGTSISTAVLNTEGDAETNYAFPVGNHSVTGSYSGDASYNSSTASATTFTVTKATPAMAIVTPPTTLNTFHVIVENTSNLTIVENQVGATVPAAPPTGSVTITSTPSGISGTFPLSGAVDPSTGFVDAVAAVTTSAAAGTYTVTANYSGDANYAAASTSASVTLTTGTGLTSTIAAATSGTISPNSTLTISGTVTGQSGSAAPTGSVDFFSSGINLGSVVVTAGAGTDVSTFGATVNSSELPQGANIITLQYSGDTVYKPSSTTLSAAVSNPLSDFTIVPNSPNVAVAAGSSGSDTIQLGSVNGFTGAVSLSCSGPTGITCSPSPASATLTADGTASTNVTINVASTVANGSYQVSVMGTDSTGEFIHTAGVVIIVSGSSTTSSSFALTASSIGTITAGESGTSTITVTPSSGFTGNVALTCSVSSTSTGVGCSLSPTSVDITAGALTSTLTVTTTTSSAAVRFPMTKYLTGAGGVMLAFVVFFGIPARRKSWHTILGLLVVIVLAAGLGCGGSGGSGGGGGGGGQSATYTVTVTGTSGSLPAQTTSLSVTVSN